MDGHDWDVRTRPGDPTFIDPEVMTTENCYGYFRREGSWVYVALLSEMELAVILGEGQCPSAMRLNHIAYYR